MPGIPKSQETSPWVHLLAAGSSCRPSPNGVCQGPEVPLALSVGMRRWFGLCLGFCVELILRFFRFLHMLPGTSVHLRKVFLLINCFGWVPMGHSRQGAVDDNSAAWQEESRTVTLKQLRLFSTSWAMQKKVASPQPVAIQAGRAQPWEADKGRSSPGAEGLIDSQCRGFKTGRSTVVLGLGAVQEA